MTFWDVVFLLGVGILACGLGLYDSRYALMFCGIVFMVVGVVLSNNEGEKKKSEKKSRVN